MKSLKIVFFGTPEFAKTTLEAILESEHKVVAVVTAPDKASGRGQKIHQSAVKIFASEKNIPIFQPDKLRDIDFLTNLKKLDADVFVVVAFRMLPKLVFDIPKLGTFNLHASLLPDYRGAAPINYAIINGEEKTGVTTFYINEKIDEGNILLQEETIISPNENAGELHDRLMYMGAKLVVKTLNGIAEKNIKQRPQPTIQTPKTAFKIFKKDTIINWNQTGLKIYNFIRGMSPYPSAITFLKIGNETKQLKIQKGNFQIKKHSFTPGKLVISKFEFFIYTVDGLYFPEEVQLEGKKMMNKRDFLNGLQSFEGIEIVL